MEIEKLFSEEEIEKKVEELANALYEKYGDEKVVFVCILKGAVFFTCELLKKYKGNAVLEFLRTSSYDGENSTGIVELILPISKENIENNNVIIVEDIVDTGRTLKFLKGYINDMNPKSLEICTLLNKPSRRVVEFEPDYCGFEIDNLFVIGYGLDYNQEYRNLPYIGVMK